MQVEKIKVFLVEDEFIIREGIKNIDWESHGFYFCGEASDGELAFPLIKKEKPDIVITDIRMPFMDGLELSQLIKKEFPAMKIIILSGHEEFQYAKSAIGIGVEEYLLKPISSEDLLRELAKTADKIREERSRENEMAMELSESSELREMEKREFFNQLVCSDLSMVELLERGRKLGMELTASFYEFLLLKVQMGEKTSYVEPVIRIHEEIRRYTEERSRGIYCFDRAPEGLILLFLADEKDVLQRALSDFISFFQQRIEKMEHIGYFGSTGSPVSRLRELNHAYETASHGFSYRFFVENNVIVHYEEMKHEIITAHSQRKDEGFSVGKINFGSLDKSKIESFLRGGDCFEIPFFIDEYMKSAGEAGKNSLIFRQYIVMDMYIAASHFLQQMGLEERFSYKEPFESPSQMEYLLSDLDKTEEHMVTMFEEVMRLRDEKVREQNDDVVETAKRYIQENYSDEELSLNAVSKEVNISPNHFSAVFSQKMGQTFVRYLTDVRLGKAKELLKSTNMRSSEISEAVGYKDPHYFSHLFKKNMGCTPMQYREGVSHEE